LKEKGNEAYKQRKFDDALQFYTQAIELDKENMLLYSNRSAVYFEMGKYDESIKEGEQSIEVGTNHTASYKNIAKVQVRIGNAFMKQQKYAEAVKILDKALINDRIAPTLELKKKVKKKKI